MSRDRLVCVLCIAGLGLLSVIGSAAAGPRVTVAYQYYPVDGTTALELMRNLHLHGPNVSGEGAYAVTNSEFTQAGAVVAGSSCRIPRYTIGVKFTILLPAAQDVPGAPPRVRTAWRSFYNFVRAHEERHKAIWIGCASAMQAKVRALRAATCDALAPHIDAVLVKEQSAWRVPPLHHPEAARAAGDRRSPPLRRRGHATVL